ncbi:MAG: hypothetical protein HY342_04935 [Candidatus Lambdaproteobacteria bacterium]|nr:hypothetical protein [Candidatus Lambdaproteobacteria bacterium]
MSALGVASPAVPIALADPVRSVLVEPGDQTAGKFFSDLATWWRFRDIPSSDRLVVQGVRGEQRRLHEVNRGRGDFALVSMDGLALHQEEYPTLAVIAVLWPNYLHVLTRNPAPAEFAWPLQWPLRVARGAEYVQNTLHALLRHETGQEAVAAAGNASTIGTPPLAGTLRPSPQAPAAESAATAGSATPDGAAPEPPLPDWRLPPEADVLADLNEAIVLLSAPLPTPQVLSAATATDTAPLRLLPLSAELLEELKLTHAWLLVGGLRPERYPFLRQGIEVPVAYTVVVARRDLPVDSARKMLQGLYEYTSQAALVNPLFAQVDKANLKVFNGIVPLHPATRAEYALPDPAGTTKRIETTWVPPAAHPAPAPRRAPS